ncbi:MGMT family protein [soil metagenome]
MKGKPESDFFYMVFEVVRLVPAGRVTTYGAIAKYLGMKGSSRMVGWAMNASHSHHSHVPAHRVVNREGMLTGKHHFATPKMMEELLVAEGIKVKKDKIDGFKNHFWDPNEELKL